MRVRTARCYRSTWPDGLHARLPTEAEWEASCRAGSRSDLWFGDGGEAVEQMAWVHGTSGGRSQPVDTSPDLRPPHPWGLVGMHGNVWEWCYDIYWDEVGRDARVCPRDSCHVDESCFTGMAHWSVHALRAHYERISRRDLLAELNAWVEQYGEEALNRRYDEVAGARTRVLRGGSWVNEAAHAASAYRGRGQPVERNRNSGFRVCLSPRPVAAHEG